MWGDIKRGMCFAHVIENVDKQLCNGNVLNVREEIEDDIRLMQQASSSNKVCLQGLYYILIH